MKKKLVGSLRKKLIVIVKRNRTVKKMSTDGYLTDTCSLDALSEHEEEMTVCHQNQQNQEVTPVGHSGVSRGLNCTPTPLFSMLDIHTPVAAPHVAQADPKVAYIVGKELLNDCSLLAALKVTIIVSSSAGNTIFQKGLFRCRMYGHLNETTSCRNWAWR